MVPLEKWYFTIDEIAERWKLHRSDLAYMAEMDELRLSVRVDDILVERGILEAEEGVTARIRYERSVYNGLQELTARDASRVFRKGSAEVRDFHVAAPGEYIGIVPPSAPVRVKPKHLFVRRAERNRIETKNGHPAQPIAEGLGFLHTPDYRYVRKGEALMMLGVVQSRAIRILHQAAGEEIPWRSGKTILGEAGATSLRMADVFKSQPDWKTFIESDERGNYRLLLEAA